jgi:hypothetical protein
MVTGGDEIPENKDAKGNLIKIDKKIEKKDLGCC